jgi:3-dehydroquinate synthetase
MLSDKKNSNDKINLILLKGIGKGYFKRGLDKQEIKKLLN